MSVCTQCGNFMFSDFHRCPPKWRVWRKDETQEDARTVRASDPQDAVEVWAEEDDRDSADYCIVNGSQAEVYVAPDDDSAAPQLFVVSGEYAPQYYAKEIT